jgi:hypothetical protein
LSSEVGRYMTGIRRSPTRVLAIVTTILALTALALAIAPTASASSGSSARRGALHIAKECTQDTGLADSFCTITSSNLSAITVGSRVVYFQAFDATGTLHSDIAVVVGLGNLALGHVDLPSNPAGPGVVTLSGGTVEFTQFHARAVVTCDPTGIFCNWDGTFRFGGGD